MSGGPSACVWLDALHSFNHQLVQTRSTFRYIIDNLLPHPPLPKSLKMIGNTRHRFFSRIAGEEQGDLVRVVNHVFRAHASLRICVVSRRVSRYCSCHSDKRFARRTSTAVTLYSGQLVAQSENSVVTTLAPVMAWWNVV